ncbi:MAG: O-antigen ligase family protein [Verrucomicrobiales bacterium]
MSEPAPMAAGNRPQHQEILMLHQEQNRFYAFCDHVSGLLLLSMVALAPWLFGTVEDWSRIILDGLGITAGGLLALKRAIRWKSGFTPERWHRHAPIEQTKSSRWLTRLMAALTFLLLGYSFTSAWNARAIFNPVGPEFIPIPYIQWLPSSFDQDRSWDLFWMYSGLACFFWSLRDWILGVERDEAEARKADYVPLFPSRLRLLLWVFGLNATLLTLIGIFQRLTNSTQLLWLRNSWLGSPESSFASFSYNGNAAQYLNIVWPATMALWWGLREDNRLKKIGGMKVGSGPQALLLPCVIATAAAPIISLNPGGAIIATLGLLVAAFILYSHFRSTWRVRLLVCTVALAAVGFGILMAGESLLPSLRVLFSNKWVNPQEVHFNAEQMAADYPLGGIGPGAVRSLYFLYRSDPSQPWLAHLHDDWLETRLSFGWVGSMMIVSLLALTLARWFTTVGIVMPWEIVGLFWISLGGCLIHAKFDFPLQVYSVLQAFLLVCAVLSVAARRE